MNDEDPFFNLPNCYQLSITIHKVWGIQAANKEFNSVGDSFWSYNEQDFLKYHLINICIIQIHEQDF